MSDKIGAALNRLVFLTVRVTSTALSVSRLVALRCAYLFHRKGLSPERLGRVLIYSDPWPTIWATGIVWTLDG